MKRLIAAAILLFIVVAVALTGRLITEYFYNSLSDTLEDCIQCYKNGDKKTAALKAAELENGWDSVRFYLAAFINRDILEDIEASLSRTHTFAKTENDSMFLSESELLSMLFSHMLETEKFTWLSVF